MQPSAPEQREARFRANTVMRWLAMSIVAAPEESRAAQDPDRPPEHGGCRPAIRHVGERGGGVPQQEDG